MNPAIWGNSIALDREFVRPGGPQGHEPAFVDDPERELDTRPRYPRDPRGLFESCTASPVVRQEIRPGTLSIVTLDPRLVRPGGLQEHEPASANVLEMPADETSGPSLGSSNLSYPRAIGSVGEKWTGVTTQPTLTIEHVYDFLEGPSELDRVTIKVEYVIDVASAHVSDLFAKGAQTLLNHETYRARIEMLREDAGHDGIVLNAASERDFWRFIESEPFIRKGSLVLLDNGNLRAVWRDASGTQLGLQFLGSGMVQYVVFKRRSAAAAVSRVAGRDSLEDVKRVVRAYDLRALIEE